MKDQGSDLKCLEDLNQFINNNVDIQQLKTGIKMVKLPLKYKLFANVDPELVDCVKTKWPWTKSVKEATHCHVNDITEAPRCLECDDIVPFNGKRQNYGYADFCSTECATKWASKLALDKNKIKQFIKNYYFLDNMTKTNRELCSEKKMIDSGFASIMNKVKSEIPFAEDLTEAMYAYYHDIHERPVCLRCGNKVRFVDVKTGYKKFCSLQCAKNSQAKIKVELNSKEDIINFIKYTYFKENSNSPKDRWRSDVSVHKVIKNEEALEALYNEHPWTRKSGRFLELAYCVKNNIKTAPRCLVCGNETDFYFTGKRYDAYCTRRCYGFHIAYKSDASKMKTVFQDFINELSGYRDSTVSDEIYYKWLKEYSISEYTLRGWLDEYNIKYDSIAKRSSLELELRDYLDSLNVEYLENDRKVLKGKELDFLIPDKKLAIEMHGSYWHDVEQLAKTRFNGDISKAKNYHLDKFTSCMKQGITLFQIHENEWRDAIKREIWKSRIAVFLGAETVTKIHARKCQIKLVGHDEASGFLETSHLDGAIPASIRLGLYYQDELVAMMTFGKNRFSKQSSDKNTEYELYRYAVKPYTRIPGGASRLLKHFVRNYTKPGDSLISFSSNDISNGNLYKKLGFKYSRTTESHFYVDQSGQVYNRIKLQKHRLPELLNIDPSELENKTAAIILQEHGFHKIYSSGMTRWILDI